jgi:hypothetical protein
MTKIEVGDLLYEVKVGITKVTEFGVGILDATVPDAVLPLAGARFDIAVAGMVTGRVEGTFEGVDYLHVRADRRSQLHIHGVITTPDGSNIALYADGVAVPDDTPGVFQLRENVTMTTAAPEFEWVNSLQIWGQGTVDMNTLQIEISGYVA